MTFPSFEWQTPMAVCGQVLVPYVAFAIVFESGLMRGKMGGTGVENADSTAMRLSIRNGSERGTLWENGKLRQ